VGRRKGKRATCFALVGGSKEQEARGERLQEQTVVRSCMDYVVSKFTCTNNKCFGCCTYVYVLYKHSNSTLFQLTPLSTDTPVILCAGEMLLRWTHQHRIGGRGNWARARPIPWHCWGGTALGGDEQDQTGQISNQRRR
jgi:hypothetical protein